MYVCGDGVKSIAAWKEKKEEERARGGEGEEEGLRLSSCFSEAQSRYKEDGPLRLFVRGSDQIGGAVQCFHLMHDFIESLAVERLGKSGPVRLSCTVIRIPYDIHEVKVVLFLLS